jgi:hypothetical protein
MSETELLNINSVNNSIGKNTEIETNDAEAAKAAADADAEAAAKAAADAEAAAKAAADAEAAAAAAKAAVVPGKVEPGKVEPGKVDNNIIPPAADAGPGPGPGPGPAEAEAKTPPTGPAAAGPTKIDNSGHDSRSGSRHDSDDSNKTQRENDEKAKKDAEEAKKKILDQIKKLELDLILKGKELDIKYVAAVGDDETKEELKAEMYAFSTNINEEIDKLYEELNGKDDQPAIIKLLEGAWGLVKLKVKVIVTKMKLAPEVKEAQLGMVDIISKKIKEIESNDSELDTKYAGEISALLASLEKSISPPPIAESGGGSPGQPGLDPAAAAAAAKAAGLDPKAAAAAAAAAGLDPKAPAAAAAAAGLDPKAPAAEAPAAEAPAAEAPATDELLPDPTEAEGEQGGGGISRKRGHPKYINQISENRNKIFKKELEIINSIRHFHRSHTIRKRDKINSILGLRKSKNNKRSSNTKNTRRHRHEHQHKHRHNNHKHKSAKHIKK